MTRLLHLSDPHFGTERDQVVEDLVRLAHRLAPDAIVLSGDLTQRATREQFAAAAAFVRRLPAVARLVLPGNHDIPLFNLLQRFAAPYRHYRGFAADHGMSPRQADGDAVDDDGLLNPRLDLPGLSIAGASTARPWRQQQGALSERQIRDVARHLQARPRETWRIAVTHHPLMVTRDEDDGDRPLGHARALQQWSDAGVDVVLGGHVHLPAVLRWRSPTNGRAVWIVKAGTAVSDRTLPNVPNSVNLLTQTRHHGMRQRVVERYDHDAARGSFELAARDPIDALDGGAWPGVAA